MAASGSPSDVDESPEVDVGPLRYHPGDLVADKYRLEELLGEGGMGTVWRAKNLALDADVAVKLVHAELLGAESSERLRREAHATARLEHPSAVRVFDLGETWLGDAFIVMELLRGRSLRALLEERARLGALELVALVLPIASAVAAAHAKGIVHRDLKPENLMLVEDESGHVVPKVLDFGIAKVEGAAASGRSTQAGTILGSPEYMSPEQARGEVDRIDARTDIWSLGVVVYEALSGRSPFAAGHPLAMLRAVIDDEVPTLEALGLADAKLSAIVERAMQKDPDARHEDMRSMGRALAEWATGQGLDTDCTGASIAAHWLRDVSLASLRTSGRVGLARASLSSVDDSPSARRSNASTVPGPPAEAPKAPPASEGALAPRSEAEAPPPTAPVVELRARPRRGGAVAVAALALVLGGAGTAAVVLGLGPSPSGAPAHAPQVATSTPSSLAPAPSPQPPVALADAPPAASASAALPSASASVGLAPSASAALPPPPAVEACMGALFPDRSFATDAELGFVCAESDPRKVATRLRSEIARQGLLRGETTEGMRLWALLSWYELALVAVAKGSCCTPEEARAIELPPSVGACPELRGVLTQLADAVRTGAEPERAIADFRLTSACIERGYRLNAALSNPYPFKSPVGSGSESAFRRVLERARPTPARPAPAR